MLSTIRFRNLFLGCLALVVTFGAPELASAPAPEETFRDCPNCPEMVVIPAGRFRMGDVTFARYDRYAQATGTPGEKIRGFGSQVEQQAGPLTGSEISPIPLSRREAIYKNKLDHMIEELKNLPRLCKGSASLSDKTKRFQGKLEEIKTKALELKILKAEYGIGFLNPLDEMFHLHTFIVYVYEDRFIYDFEIPPQEKYLREHLKFLSEDFQLLYRANFQNPSKNPKDFHSWAKYITLSLRCLSEQ